MAVLHIAGMRGCPRRSQRKGSGWNPGRAFAFVAAFVVLMICVGAPLGGTTPCNDSAHGSVTLATHSDGTECPDSQDKDHPCGSDCACLCCHAPTAALDYAVRVELPERKPNHTHTSYTFRPHERPYLRDVRERIYHPPRA